MTDELVVQVEKRFPAVVIAADLRVALAGGTILVLFGPSGSGKTTLIRAIAGLERPERGRIEFGGVTWLDCARGVFVPPDRRRVGYVFQEGALFPHLSVRGNVAYGLHEWARTDRHRRAEEAMVALELSELRDRFPRQLSGGQAQRVALARALAPEPRLLLLDEPFAALDAPARTRLRGLLRGALSRLGIGCVLVTHDRTEAIALGDLMAVLAGGRVRQVGPVLDVMRRPADLVVARSVGVEAVLPAAVAGTTNGLVELRIGPTLLRAADTTFDPQTREVFACIRAEDVTLERTPSAGSARNQLPGRIVSFESEGPVERVTLDCGFPLTALITRHAHEELALKEGATVFAAVKATAVHLVPKS
jgi:molybdate transport system ATP-binding protein